MSTDWELLEGRASWPGSAGILVLNTELGTTGSQQTPTGGGGGGGASAIWGKVFLTTLICLTSPIFHFQPRLSHLRVGRVEGGGDAAWRPSKPPLNVSLQSEPIPS